MTPSTQQIRLQTNESNFYRNLAVVFADKTKVLSELIQNSRRAGASAIHFTMDGTTLVIEDNGSGIEDFQKLLTNSESGWSDQTCQSEGAFGMGWLSTLFSAKQVQIESRGQKCLLDTQSVIEMQPATVVKSDYIGHTRISLIEFALDERATLDALKSIVKGFSVPYFSTALNYLGHMRWIN